MTEPKIRIDRVIHALPPRSQKWAALLELEVGHSLTVDIEEYDRVRNAASYYKRKIGKIFEVRQVNKQKVRVWRIQ